MEEMSTTTVPLGSLAILFAVISVLVLIRKTSLTRETDLAIKERIEAKKKLNNLSLSEQKKRLDLLLKK